LEDKTPNAIAIVTDAQAGARGNDALPDAALPRKPKATR
jgi:hypothetical protein